MATGAVDKLSYLKRYMSDGKDGGDQRKKKKKKKTKLSGKGITVIDADFALSGKSRKPADHDDEELAPTIAEINDETIPKGMSDSTKWKSIVQNPSSGKRNGDRSSLKIKRESPDSDISPPRQKQSRRRQASPDSDISPPRRNEPKATKQQNGKGEDSDLSPDRDTSTKRKTSAPRTSRTQRGSSDSDLSPARSTRPAESSSRADEIRPSGSRRVSKTNTRSEDGRRRRDDSGDLSPPRGQSMRHDERSSRTEEGRGLPTKTLSGMSAGIQNARTLREEMDQRRQREDEMFKKMDADISGRGAETIYRDRKTGKKRDVEAERAAEADKAERERKHNERYDKWGKGLAQAKEREQGREDALHEMDKPLARYVDDADRDALLKAQDRIGDPMLEYLTKKKGSTSGTVKVERPKYKGPPPPPNRYGILPGYRWDGLDRSNGFEKTRFNRISNKTATNEQAYKWSTEDM